MSSWRADSMCVCLPCTWPTNMAHALNTAFGLPSCVCVSLCVSATILSRHPRGVDTMTFGGIDSAVIMCLKTRVVIGCGSAPGRNFDRRTESAPALCRVPSLAQKTLSSATVRACALSHRTARV